MLNLMRFSNWAFALRRLGLALTCVLAVLLVSCGGGSGSTASTDAGDLGSAADADGELVISLTDAEGDFLTYLVEVDSLTLHRANGAVVEALPVKTAVDFAQYVEVTELLNILTVPTGRYDSAEITLDYTNANITVQDENGDSIVAEVLDAQGNPLTTVTVAIDFSDHDGFTIRRGVPAHVTLDFDLDASNEITIDNGQATVTVSPVFLADTIFEQPKSFRLRGLLGPVAVADNFFAMDIRPFRRRMGHFGAARVHVNENTQFEIDQQSIPNEEGLLTLEALDVGSAVVTEGEWNRINRQYVAVHVYAGTSVPWSNADMLHGTVVSRNGNIVHVRGATVEMADGEFVFRDTVTMTVADTTNVFVFGSDESDSSIADISVGSRIYAIGDITAPGEIDATDGLVRVQLGTIAGTVVNTSPLALDLSFINARRVSRYDFTGTGIDAANDADPGYYEIDTGSLSLDDVLPGDPIRSLGLVMEYGQAPEDFIARTLVNAANIRAHMVIAYGLDGSAAAISTLDETGILFNLDESMGRHHIFRAGIATDLNDLAVVPQLIPGGDRGIYAISRNGRTRVYSNYADFLSTLTMDLDAGALVSRIDAHGQYDSVLAHFTSQRFRVKLTDTE